MGGCSFICVSRQNGSICFESAEPEDEPEEESEATSDNILLSCDTGELLHRIELHGLI